jgi:hypothetical protein
VGACGADSDNPSTRVNPGTHVNTSSTGGATSTTASTDVGRDASFGNANPDAGTHTPGQGPCGGFPCVDAGGGPPDDDGFTVADGDCDDHSELVNPGAYDVPNNGIDDDCQGGDATSDACDDMLDLAASDPLAAARAIELCAMTKDGERRWGVVSARWTTPDGNGTPGSAMMHGLLPDFGPSFKPRAGKSFLALSSGVARAPGQAGFTQNCSDEFPTQSNAFPKGFDGTSTSCPADAQATSIVDAVALELRVRMPTNASALSFDSAFVTDEYPQFICSPFNDFFQVLVDPKRPGSSADSNVVFDLDGNSVSVNNSLLRACTAGTYGGKTFDCPLGFTPIKGTGYENCSFANGGFFGGGFFGGGAGQPVYGASTGWLTTEFAVDPGEVVTLRFTIWDSGDSSLDSLALIDHVHFRLREKEPPPPDKPMTVPQVVE